MNESPRDHDPAHPYLRTLKGCGHGRLFSEPCVDCEVVGLMEEYKACRENGAAGARQNAPVSEDRWQPIETAPKDKFVLLAGPSGYTTIEIVYATGRMCSDYHVGRWIDHANDDLTDWGFEPTHWRPLPKAPAMQEDKP